MTTIRHSHQYQQSHLPPSPPPSPPQSRHHQTKTKKKKPHDPFLELSHALPSEPQFPEPNQDPQESIIHRIILTPILFTSFLLSLFLVNHRDRRRRLEEHTSTTRNILAYLSPSTWLDPEPYQDPSNTTWDRRGSVSHVEPHSVLNPDRTGTTARNRKRNSWHLRKKIRKVARLEVSDAFEMRGRVIVLMVSVVALFLVVVAWVLKSVAVNMMSLGSGTWRTS